VSIFIIIVEKSYLTPNSVMENSSDHETQNGIESVTSGPPLLGMIEGRQSPHVPKLALCV
jgi:hypothetical protein